MGFDSAEASLTAISGDASFRRYFRLEAAQGRAVLCDAPPAREKNREFVAIAKGLAAAGLRVPAVYGADYERGWLCLEDLGDDTLLPHLHGDSVDGYYHRALAMLERLARVDAMALKLPAYNRALLEQEMDLFPEWFCKRLLGVSPGERANRCYRDLRSILCERALAQPQVVVHRDFHSRNLMLAQDGTLATIDFQDAVRGPVTYDPVSLLRDCYLRWPEARVRRWALEHRDGLLAAGVPVTTDDEVFLTDFDWMGLQRHIKVLGIFARLSQRDGKDTYLRDLPRVIAYTVDVLDAYPGEPACAAFAAWLRDDLLPTALRQPWYIAP